MAVATDLMAYVGCVSGAIQRADYLTLLSDAGLGEIEILKDTDFLAVTADSLPEEIATAMAEIGLTAADLDGIVRSVTYRARRALT